MVSLLVLDRLREGLEGKSCCRGGRLDEPNEVAPQRLEQLVLDPQLSVV